MREFRQWLAAEDEPDLTRNFDLWLGALGQKWDVELPSIRDYEEAQCCWRRSLIPPIGHIHRAERAVPPN